MDEPTNHLDSETVDQLTQWIQQTKATVRVISHDRYRINQRAEYCYFLDQQQIKKYTGNYDDFVRRREEELEKQEQEHHDRIKKKKSEEKLIQTIRQRATVHKSPKWGKLLRHRMKVYQRNIIDHEKTRPTQESQVSYTMHGGQHKKKRVIEWSQLLIIEKGGRHISLMPCAISAQDRIVIT
jgi:ATPase subunit of ABC transporter with duplicated ATPase domains